MCTCCTRRAVLTSLGGAIVANVTAERTSLAVEGSIPSADVRLGSCDIICKGFTYLSSLLVMLVCLRSCGLRCSNCR